MLKDFFTALGTGALNKVLHAVLVLVIGILIIRIVTKLLHGGLEKSHLEKAAHSLILSLAKVAMYILLGLSVASMPLAQNNKEKRTFSIHGPCVAVNLADSSDEYYLKAYAQTFTYAQKIKAEFVVVHTNEIYHGEFAAVKELVYQRLAEVISLAQSYGVQVVIENVGLRPCGSLLFDFEEYLALFERYPQALALLDTGHAHVNGWNLPETVKRLQKKLLAVHVHDNDGSGDSHQPVGLGTIEWEPYFASIRDYAPNALQILEYAYIEPGVLTEHLHKLESRYGALRF